MLDRLPNSAASRAYCGHGARKRCGWRKLHLGVDGSGAIVAGALTESTADDATTGIALVDQVAGDIVRVAADTAYDTLAFYDAARKRGARVKPSYATEADR